MNRSWIFLGMTFIALQCKNPPEKKDNSSTEGVEQSSHLPVREILLDDLKKVDSSYTVILMKTEEEGKRDSSYIPLDTFKRWATSLLPHALDSAIFHSCFSETSFKDESTGMFQFIYEDTSYMTDLRKMIVYIKPGTGNDHVHRIYLESGNLETTGIWKRKVIWNMEHYILVMDSRKKEQEKETIRISRAIWDPAYFSEE